MNFFNQRARLVNLFLHSTNGGIIQHIHYVSISWFVNPVVSSIRMGNMRRRRSVFISPRIY